MLMTWAPLSTARSIARARSSWEQDTTFPAGPSPKTGRKRPRQPGAMPVTELPGWPNITLATCVPCAEARPLNWPLTGQFDTCSTNDPRKHGWDKSTGPSMIATHTFGLPREIAHNVSIGKYGLPQIGVSTPTPLPSDTLAIDSRLRLRRRSTGTERPVNKFQRHSLTPEVPL